MWVLVIHWRCRSSRLRIGPMKQASIGAKMPHDLMCAAVSKHYWHLRRATTRTDRTVGVISVKGIRNKSWWHCPNCIDKSVEPNQWEKIADQPPVISGRIGLSLNRPHDMRRSSKIHSPWRFSLTAVSWICMTHQKIPRFTLHRCDSPLTPTATYQNSTSKMATGRMRQKNFLAQAWVRTMISRTCCQAQSLWPSPMMGVVRERVGCTPVLLTFASRSTNWTTQAFPDFNIKAPYIFKADHNLSCFFTARRSKKGIACPGVGSNHSLKDITRRSFPRVSPLAEMRL